MSRSILKTFVTEGADFFKRLAEQDISAISKVRSFFRNPAGPWRHGSIYLFVLEPSGYTYFHGAFPNQLELVHNRGAVRDTVTGKDIVAQIIEAAQRNPEGGFVEYHYDDPNDDTDSADLAKVTYVRQFSVRFSRQDRQHNFIVGAGFFPGSPEVVAAHRNTVVKTVLPQIMRAMTASTVDAVSDRIQQATSGTRPAEGFSLGGASTLSDALLANGRALGTGSFDLSRLLAGSSFTLPLNAPGTGGSGLIGNLALWGSGDYRNVSGNRETLEYEGDVVSANLGIDTKLTADLLAGVSVAWARGQVDYTVRHENTGVFTTDLTSINPYLGWQAPSGMNLWATAGYGWGEIEIDDELAETQARDLTQQMVAAGVNGPLASSDQQIEGGTTRLRLKGETAFTWADVDGAENIGSTTLNASRQRLLLEGIHVRKLASGTTLTPSIEIGMRYDGGDGETGSSVEIGAGLRYANPATGLTMRGRARTLLAHSSDYEEWGVSGLVRFDPGARGLGFSLSLQPAWGQTASGVQRLWNSGVAGLTANDQTGRVNARIAYGFGTTWSGQGVLTPYTDVSLSGEGSQRLSLGGQFKIGSSVRMSLEGVQGKPARGATNHGVLLRGDTSW